MEILQTELCSCARSSTKRIAIRFQDLNAPGSDFAHPGVFRLDSSDFLWDVLDFHASFVGNLFQKFKLSVMLDVQLEASLLL